MKEIKLTKGKVALVDDEDYVRLQLYNWHLLGGKYAARYTPTGSRLMEKDVMEVMDNVMLDHKDMNPLNNQRTNLRVANKSRNSQNRGLQSNSTSGYKGVCASKGKWQAHIKYHGQKVNLGTYVDKKEAAHAYNVAAKKFFGEFARLNVIDEEEPVLKKLMVELENG